MKKGFLLTLLLAFGLSACAPSGGGPSSFRLTAQAGGGFAASAAATLTPEPTSTETPVPPTDTPIPAPSMTPTSVLFPQVTLVQNGICRTGPNLRYNRTGDTVTKGKSYQVNGRSADSSWITLQTPGVGDYCWVQPTVLNDTGIVAGLNVIEVQSLPDSPTNLISNSFACGFKKRLRLTWYPVYSMGYHIYRNGRQIGTVYDGEFVDLSTPQSSMPTDYQYSVEAFNASGVSIPNTITVTLCN